MLGDPDDPEIYILVDPITADLVLSPKLVRAVESRLAKERSVPGL